MRKRVKITAMILSSAMLLSAAACGSQKTDATTSGAPADAVSAPAEKPESKAPGSEESSAPAGSGEKVTISYWTTNRHDQEYLTPLITEFNETNQDNIYIDYQVYADNYSQMLDLAFSTGSAPDIFQLPNITLEELEEKGYAMDIGPYMDEAYRQRFGENAFVEGINAFGEKIYSLPYTASAVRLFYNQDIFDRVGIEAPPKSLEEMVAYTKLITEQLSGEGIYGFAANYKSVDAIRRTVDQIVMVSGGTRAGFDYQTGTYDFSSFKPVLEGFREMFAGGYAFPGCESLDIDPLRTQFAAGKIGMYISLSHAEPGVYQSQFPTEINWNCAPIPAVGGEIKGKQQLWSGGAQLAVNAGTKNPEESFKVMQFLHSDEVMSGYYEKGLGTVMIPAVMEKATPPETIKKMPNLELTDNDKNWPVLPSKVVVEGKSYLDSFVEVVFGVTDADAAIADLNKRYNEAYDKVISGGATRIVYPNFTPENLDISQ